MQMKSTEDMHTYLHQRLWIVPCPLLEPPSLGKPTKSREWWGGCNPVAFKIVISVYHIAVIQYIISLTGDRYHLIYYPHESLHVSSADNQRSIAQDGPWTFPWLADVGYQLIASRECLREGNESWTAASGALWDQMKPWDERRTVMSSSMPYSSHSILESIISLSLSVWWWDRRPAWPSRLAGIDVHLWNNLSV